MQHWNYHMHFGIIVDSNSQIIYRPIYIYVYLYFVTQLIILQFIIIVLYKKLTNIIYKWQTAFLYMFMIGCLLYVVVVFKHLSYLCINVLVNSSIFIGHYRDLCFMFFVFFSEHHYKCSILILSYNNTQLCKINTYSLMDNIFIHEFGINLHVLYHFFTIINNTGICFQRKLIVR